jgi:hypothetical protein
MIETSHPKQQIVAALTEVRVQVQNELSHLRRTLNMKQHLLVSYKSHPWEWASGAALVGWLLSRLPARKKRIYIHSSTQKSVKNPAEGPLGKFWKEVWKISKPLIAAYVAKLLAEQNLNNLKSGGPGPASNASKTAFDSIERKRT